MVLLNNIPKGNFMISKTFVFSKITKSVQTIEETVNDWLKDNEFKIATQNESTIKGKFIITVFANPKKSSIRAKVFKDQHIPELDAKVNEFLVDRILKGVTQTFVGSNVYTVLFYDSKSKDADGDNTSTTT
jgi:hypothetical protein